MTDPLTQSLPPRIWLQVNPDGDPEDRSEPLSESSWGDLSWCYHSIGGQEVGYVREDLAANAWGILGLIADIRAAAGDREGRLMQPELVEHIRQLKSNADAHALLAQASAVVIIERDRLRAECEALRANAAASDQPKSDPDLLEWMAAELNSRQSLDREIAFGVAATLRGWACLLREVAARAAKGEG